MKTFKKSSTAIITTLALGLLPALPAAAQTAQASPAAQADAPESYQRESGNPDSPMTFTVVQKPGVDSEEVMITWTEHPKAKQEQENGHVYFSTVEYDVETSKGKVVNVQ